MSDAKETFEFQLSLLNRALSAEFEVKRLQALLSKCQCGLIKDSGSPSNHLDQLELPLQKLGQ